MLFLSVQENQSQRSHSTLWLTVFYKLKCVSEHKRRSQGWYLFCFTLSNHLWQKIDEVDVKCKLLVPTKHCNYLCFSFTILLFKLQKIQSFCNLFCKFPVHCLHVCRVSTALLWVLSDLWDSYLLRLLQHCNNQFNSFHNQCIGLLTHCFESVQ